jgi:hypothetical protein
MIRLATLFWLVLVSATGFAMFGVKYQVQGLDDELGRVRKATAAEEHETRVLDAEWAYLTRPEILTEMSRRFLSLGPVATKQLRTAIADIPMRPAPPPPVEVAEAPEAPPPAADMSVATASPAAPAEAPAAPAAPPPASEPKLAAAEPATPTKPVPASAAKPAPIKLAARREAPPHRPKSLDDLFAQVSAAR